MGESRTENSIWTPPDFWSQFKPEVTERLQAIQNPLAKQILAAGKVKFEKFAQFAEDKPTRETVLISLRHSFGTLAKLPEEVLNQTPVDQPDQLIGALNQEMGGKIFLGQGDIALQLAPDLEINNARQIPVKEVILGQTRSKLFAEVPDDDMEEFTRLAHFINGNNMLDNPFPTEELKQQLQEAYPEGNAIIISSESVLPGLDYLF